jgi:hypothetical protein
MTRYAIYIVLVLTIWFSSLALTVNALDLFLSGDPRALWWACFGGAGYWLALCSVLIAEELER